MKSWLVVTSLEIYSCQSAALRELRVMAPMPPLSVGERRRRRLFLATEIALFTVGVPLGVILLANVAGVGFRLRLGPETLHWLLISWVLLGCLVVLVMSKRQSRKRRW